MLSLSNEPRAGYTHKISGISSSMAYVASQLWAKAPQRPLVLVCPSEHMALSFRHQLAYFLPGCEAHHFPARDILWYDTISPRGENTAERIKTLAALSNLQSGVILVSMASLISRLPPKAFVWGRGLSLSVGQLISQDQLLHRLFEAGYKRVSQVSERGEVARRGSLIELFPMNAHQAFRVDFFSDEIDSIRPFSLEGGQSKESITSLDLMVAHEFPTEPEALAQFIARYEARFESSVLLSRLAQVAKGQVVPGLESFLPLFYPQMASLFDYVPPNALWLTENNESLLKRHEHLSQNTEQSYRSHARQESNLLSPFELILRESEFMGELKRFERVSLSADKRGIISPGQYLNQDKAAESTPMEASSVLKKLESFAKKGDKLLIGAGSMGRARLLKQKLDSLISAMSLSLPSNLLPSTPPFPSLQPQEPSQDLKAALSFDQLAKAEGGQLWISDLDCLEGFYQSKAGQTDPAHKAGFALLSERDLGLSSLGSASQKTQKEQSFGLEEFAPGDYVVHQEYGVGMFKGLVTTEVDGHMQECLHLTYQGGAELFASLEEISRLHRYQSASEHETPELSEMGGKSWQQASKKIHKKIEDVASKLLHAYAKRQGLQGTAFQLDAQAYQDFAHGFPYTETPDQQTSIDAVLEDMQSPKPMGRLLCGDVGLGKTEVAMRAMFVAVHSGKQAVVLAPTTLLCEQHYERILDRFSSVGVSVVVLSRMQSASDNQAAKAAAASGEADIIIGTHKLLNCQFHDLGLLVIDEEQRFGVKQKEALRRNFESVDTLLMTATPIPRTLQMATSGLQDISLITTPPKNRLPIRTHKLSIDEDEAVIEAIIREVSRGGQVYYLYNEVRYIDEFAANLGEQLGQDVAVAVAHGQMHQTALEEVMNGFYRQRYQVLVCTTIIETGLDVPGANTVIIHHAHRLGLSQLHQIRGRVGRSHRQAHCYLVCPPMKRLTHEQHRRIDALLQHQELGSGFNLASKDLEIRGAGELLGAEQSGHVESIGYSLYLHLLQEAVAKLRSGALSNELIDVLEKPGKIDLGLPKFLSESYLPDALKRLQFYQELLEAKSLEEIERLSAKLQNNHGALPIEAESLLAWAEFGLLGLRIGLVSLHCHESGGELRLSASSHNDLNIDSLMELVATDDSVYRLMGQDTLQFTWPENSDSAFRLGFVRTLFTRLILPQSHTKLISSGELA